jgi:hypothetical protein
MEQFSVYFTKENFHTKSEIYRNNYIYDDIFELYKFYHIYSFNFTTYRYQETVYELVVNYINYDDKINSDIWFREENKPFTLSLVEEYKNNNYFTNVFKHYKGLIIFRFEIKVSHDGYDCDGPQSNLYDLTVTYLDKNNNIKKDSWHREYWFHGKDAELFSLL